MSKDLERIGIRFVTYQTGISLEPCLRVANSMGITWVVLADNDKQGVKDQEVVRRYLNGRQERDALFVMPEANIEQHLCVQGFSDVYFKLLGEQPRQKVTAQPQETAYALQVANALPTKLKTQAAQGILTAIRTEGRAVPRLFQNVIDTALKLAESL